jgi:uncharacterized protein YkwD
MYLVFLRYSKLLGACAGGLLLAAATPAPAQGGRGADRADLAVLDEINAARADPHGYAQYLRQYLTSFHGRLSQEPGRIPVRTQEGAAAVEEAIDDLERRAPAPPLSPHGAMSQAALRLVLDEGPAGRMGHVASDGATLSQRLQGAGVWAMIMEEDIAYGPHAAREVVRDLIVDDGVADRGHREAIFDRQMTHAGVACGPHAAYAWMCVIDFAGALMPPPGSESRHP